MCMGKNNLNTRKQKQLSCHTKRRNRYNFMSNAAM